MSPFSPIDQLAIQLTIHLDELPDDTLDALIQAIQAEQRRRHQAAVGRSRP